MESGPFRKKNKEEDYSSFEILGTSKVDVKKSERSPDTADFVTLDDLGPEALEFAKGPTGISHAYVDENEVVLVDGNDQEFRVAYDIYDSSEE